MAMSELSTHDLGDAPRWQYPRENNGEPSGYPPDHPAIRRIRDEARKEQMLSSRNASWPHSLSMPISVSK